MRLGVLDVGSNTVHLLVVDAHRGAHLLDIGGGSLELAAGRDEDPEVALSLPLGAGRTRQRLPGDPPARADSRSSASSAASRRPTWPSWTA
jgi:exopolyphosphatase/pppGpp-phosphohydrolase